MVRIMNKISIVNDSIIPSDNSSLFIDNKCIEFTENGNYIIEYINCNTIDLCINIKEDLCIQLFEYSDNSLFNTNITFNIEKNSSLILNKFYNNDATHEEINVYLRGEKSSINYNFSSISKGCDYYTINLYHLGKLSSSNVFNRTIARGGSSNIFDINSFVENGIKDCYLNQQTKIATLGEANNRINPNMFTHDNSVTAIHSSVIGSISDEDLFYLMSRGINYIDSIKLIIKGMILSNINPNMEYKEKILNILDKLEVNNE